MVKNMTFLVALSVWCVMGVRAEAEAPKKTMMVFAAASLVEVLSELQDSFSVKHAITIKANLASSGTLAQQIAQGAPADVFISASENWIAYLDSLNLLQKNSIAPVAFNELVLIAPGAVAARSVTIDSSLKLLALLGSGRLSMGDPAHVPPSVPPGRCTHTHWGGTPYEDFAHRLRRP
jgi:molybdate transport system substrate-binding protein